MGVLHFIFHWFLFCSLNSRKCHSEFKLFFCVEFTWQQNGSGVCNQLSTAITRLNSDSFLCPNFVFLFFHPNRMWDKVYTTQETFSVHFSIRTKNTFFRRCRRQSRELLVHYYYLSNVNFFYCVFWIYFIDLRIQKVEKKYKMKAKNSNVKIARFIHLENILHIYATARG